MPNPDRVLLRKADDGSHHEVGDLLERIQGKRWRLMLPDGTRVEHSLEPNEVAVVRGSMNYRLRVSPQSVEAQLRNDPAEAFRQLLSETPRGAKASQLKAALYGVDGALVDRAWQRAKKELDAADDVRRSDSRVPVYTLVTLAPDRHGPAAPVETQVPDPAEIPEPSGNEASFHADDAPTPTGNIDAPPPRDVSADLFIQFLLREGLIETGETLGSLAGTPLTLALALRKLKAADLRSLVPALSTEHQHLCAALLGPGKEGALRTESLNVPSEDYAALLRTGASELGKAGDRRSRLAPVLGALVERAANATEVDLKLLVEVSSALAEAGNPGGEGLDRSLEAIARHDGLVAGLKDAVLSRRLMQAARRADLSRTGGRAVLLSTLYRKAPEVARDHTWWTGVTFDHLCAAGHGPLADALEDAVIARQLVRPLVEAALRQASGRTRLAQLISSPAPVARWVDGEGLMTSLERSAKTDQVAAAWAEVLSDTSALSRMTDQFSAAQQELSESRERQHDLEEELARFRDRLRVTGEELAAARSAQTGARGARDRQAKADIVRVLARMAAQVSQSPAASQDQSLVRSINHAVTREGLSPVGEVGRAADFDPVAHDSMGQSISPDSRVTVLRPGYTWQDGEETVVLLKAQVVADGE